MAIQGARSRSEILADAPPTEELAPDGAAMGDLVIRCFGASREPRAAPMASGAVLIVGSAADTGLAVAEPTVSRKHCRLTHRGTFVLIEDLGSRNGVFVGGARVSMARVGAGAIVRVGRAWLCIDRSPCGIETEPALSGVVGSAPCMRALASRVRRFAKLELPVLVRGESGTGKELVARAVHDLSGRPGAFVALNGATISRELAESELFGHRRGAFTGASLDRKGAFREADGGTLFIDEVAALPLEVQAKLLRAVEEGVVRSLGSDCGTSVDVRIVAATCEALDVRAQTGRFRADLYERLAACIVTVPPLRERLTDLPELALHLLAKLGLQGSTLDDGAIEAIAKQPLRGNVRELRSLLVHAALAAGADALITSHHVKIAATERGARTAPESAEAALSLLAACGGNAAVAARQAGLARSTFRDLCARARSTREQGDDHDEHQQRSAADRGPEPPGSIGRKPHHDEVVGQARGSAL